MPIPIKSSTSLHCEWESSQCWQWQFSGSFFRFNSVLNGVTSIIPTISRKLCYDAPTKICCRGLFLELQVRIESHCRSLRVLRVIVSHRSLMGSSTVTNSRHQGIDIDLTPQMCSNVCVNSCSFSSRQENRPGPKCLPCSPPHLVRGRES